LTRKRSAGVEPVGLGVEKVAQPEGPLDFRQEQGPDHLPRPGSEPIQEPPGPRHFAQESVPLGAKAAEELLDFGDRFQSFALPAGVAKGASPFAGEVLNAIKGQWAGDGTLQEGRIVGG
jgi:hypothetical protein